MSFYITQNDKSYFQAFDYEFSYESIYSKGNSLNPAKMQFLLSFIQVFNLLQSVAFEQNANMVAVDKKTLDER